MCYAHGIKKNKEPYECSKIFISIAAQHFGHKYAGRLMP